MRKDETNFRVWKFFDINISRILLSHFPLQDVLYSLPHSLQQLHCTYILFKRSSNFFTLPATVTLFHLQSQPEITIKMHYTPLILLACSSLALATPYYHRHEGKWEEHSHKPCPSASSLDASGTDAASSLSAALPFPMEPIATAAALYTSSPAEAGTVSPPVSSAAPVAGTGSEPENGGGQEPPAHEPSSLPSYPAPTSAAAPVVVKSSAAAPVVAKSSTAAAVVPVASATGTVLVATFTS